MTARGEVPGIVSYGRSRRISRRALEEWVAEQVDDASGRSDVDVA